MARKTKDADTSSVGNILEVTDSTSSETTTTDETPDTVINAKNDGNAQPPAPESTDIASDKTPTEAPSEGNLTDETSEEIPPKEEPIDEIKLAEEPKIEETKPEDTPTEDNIPVCIECESKVTFKGKRVRIYSDSRIPKSSGLTEECDYFIWDSKEQNGRIRVTKFADGAGDISKFAGWVLTADIKSN